MADVFTKSKRSQVMSRIRGRGNESTELRMAAVFRELGITGWRRHQVIRCALADGVLRVQPDFVFRRARLAVFVDGCFWHGCPEHATMPANNRIWWRDKLMANRARDRVAARTLRAQGWRVLRVWEHELLVRRRRRLVRRVTKVLARAADSASKGSQ